MSTPPKLRVERWASYTEVSDVPDRVGGMGGWFEPGMRWADYVRELTAPRTRPPEPSPEAHPDERIRYALWQDARSLEHLEALRADVLERGIRQGGDWHQCDEHGAPVFSDGTAGTFSYRAWGDLMAAIWSDADSMDYGYMDFYMDCLVTERPKRG